MLATYFVVVDLNPGRHGKCESGKLNKRLIRLLIARRIDRNSIGLVVETDDLLKLKFGCQHLTCIIVAIVMSGAVSNAIPRKDGKEVPLLVSWGGQVKTELREKSPKTKYIKDSDAWEALWNAWRPTEQIPSVNFDQAVVLVAAGENPIPPGVVPVVDVDGNLTMSTQVTLIGYIDPTEFRYLFALVSRAGIKSINGDVLGPNRPQG